ncbi:MAG: VWA domain-containing protein [Beijerinckiaceae bacterium]|nr:VWA domain-containing protein [Beijerinckiaceae bacterium]
MMVFAGFALLRPWWLLVLPALGLFFYLTKPGGGALTGWARAADESLLAAMAARGGVSGGKEVFLPAILALVVGIFALSGPALRVHDQHSLRNLDATLIVMDLSTDVTDSARLRAAATVASEVIDHAGTRQTGLVLYAGDAYLASALSDDRSGIDPLLFALDSQTVPDAGVRPDRALKLAQKLLSEAHILRGDIVLISGGGGLNGDGTRQLAAALHASGHRLDTIFVSGAGIDRSDDTLRAAALASIAGAGGGLAATVAAPENVLEALSNQVALNLENSAISGLGWLDLGRFLLAVAAIPLLLGFRRAIS